MIRRVTWRQRLANDFTYLYAYSVVEINEKVLGEAVNRVLAAKRLERSNMTKNVFDGWLGNPTSDHTVPCCLSHIL